MRERRRRADVPPEAVPRRARRPRCDPAGGNRPGLSPAEVQSHLDAIVRIASGDPEGGPIAQLGLAERFHWLVAPSSTIIQTSETHTGLCHDPADKLDHLFEALVTSPTVSG